MSNYSSTYPSVSPTWQCNFAANGGRIPPNATFSRPDSPINTSNAPASAVHFWSNEKHLSSENLIKHSEGSAVWGGTATVTYNYTNGPDGVTGTALRLESASGTERYRYSTGGQFVSGTAYTVSCWVKSNTGVAQTFRFMCSTTANQSSDLTTHATDWTRVTATITPNTTNIFAGFVFLSANTNDISVWGLQVNTGSDELDYQATTTQIHRQYAPTLKSVATAGAARFEYDPTDGQSGAKGILIEGQSTNLATYGSDLTNAAWNPLSAFIGGTAVGPDGTLSAVKLVASAGSGLAPRFRRLSLLTDTTQTFSIYVKPLEFQHLAISADGSTACMVLYNLSGSGAITSATGATGAVEQCGNGWFRVSFSYTTTPSLHLAITMQSSTTYQTETGNGYDGMLFALAQLENQSFSSSFIGTTSSTVTRAVDSLTAVTSDIGYTGGPMTLVTDTTVSDPTSTEFRAAAYVFVDSNNSAGIWATSSDNRIARVETGGIGGNVGTNSGVNGKAALSIDTNDIATCLNGGTVATDTSHALADFASATLYVGNFGTYANQLNGHIKRIALFNEALSDQNLISLTS